MPNNNDGITANRMLKTFRRIFGFVKPFSGLLILVMVLNTVFSILSALSTTIIQPVSALIFKQDIISTAVNTANTKPNLLESIKNGFLSFLWHLIYQPDNIHTTIINISMLIIVIFILKNIFKYFASVAKALLEESVVKSIRDTVYGKMTSLSVDFFSKRKGGSLISIITNDVNVMNSTTISAITDILREATQIIIYLVLLIAISPYLTLIAFCTSIISLLILRVATKYLRRYAHRMQNAMADYTSILQETISGIRVVKAYNAEDSVLKRFISETQKYVHSAVKHQKIITMVPSFNEIFAIISLCVVLYIGGSQVLVTKQMNPADLMLFLFSLFSIMSPIATVINNISVIQRGFVAAERVFEIIDKKPTVQTGLEEISTFDNSIEIKNINFKYEEQLVLKNISFTVPKSKKIAFVGSSGSGKSTMLDLIIRFYDPNEGAILIDGRKITDLTIASYRSLFGIVAQETILFHETIANNIRYGFEHATMDTIIESAKIANAYNFIMAMPNGFNTLVGDRGVTLSGGEKQRIAIARALVRNPRILVFDEATSALDTESEKVVQEAINNSLEQRTAIIVAHRLSTIIDCDNILVFDKGTIAESGTHSELLAKNGIYKKLYEIQFNDKTNTLNS